jgi:hypothetical protein
MLSTAVKDSIKGASFVHTSFYTEFEYEFGASCSVYMSFHMTVSMFRCLCNFGEVQQHDFVDSRFLCSCNFVEVQQHDFTRF